MDYVGTGKRLEPGDIGLAAKSVGLPTAALLAWLEVEVGARMRGFDDKNRPIILPERHRFYAELGAGPKRARAVKEGLAYPKWGTKPYPKTMDDRYAMLERMSAIDEEAALDSTSVGLPQILGSNAEAAGSANAVAMFGHFKQSEKAQLDGMVSLLNNWGIVKSLRGKDLSKPASWEPAVSRYNGAGYKKNNYHVKIATAFVKHSQGTSDTLSVPDDSAALLRNGVKGERVLKMQADLKARGFDPGPVDGRFGDKTEIALRQMQNQAGLKVDGVFGPKTEAAMQKLPVVESVTQGDPAPPKSTNNSNKNWLAQIIDYLLDALFGALQR